MKQKLLLTLALSGAIVPLALVGCGGGNGGLLSPRPTARPNATATPSPTLPVALVPTTFALQNGQRVTLTGSRTGDKLVGKLKVEGAATQQRVVSGSQNQAFPFSLAIGEYGYTGTFTPPRGFNVVGNFGSFGNFTMTGQLQTATQDGSYSLTTGGVTDTGVLPASGTPPTPTNTATPAPPTSGYRLTANVPLTFTNVTAGSPIVPTPIASFVSKPDDKATFRRVTNASFNGTYEAVNFGSVDSVIPPSQLNGGGKGTTRTLGVTLASVPTSQITSSRPFTVGQVISLVPVDFSTGVGITQVTVNGTTFSTNIWRATSGSATIKAVGVDSVTVELKDARMQGRNITGSVDATAGEFTLNGTGTATGLTVLDK